MGHDIHFHFILGREIGELDLLVKALLAVTLHDHTQETHHIPRSPVRSLERAAHATHFQNAVNEQQQVTALTLDDFDILALAGSFPVIVGNRLFHNVVGSSHDSGQGGAQLVHNVSEEQGARLLDLTQQALRARADARRINQRRHEHQ